ncbi:MAG: SDR family NAD(P)-dependent oxidoreductase [Bacteroidia bacterium]
MYKQFFDQKVVVITGSSMGIGKSLALLLGSYHAKIVLNGRNKDKLLATELELKNLGYDVISFTGDVTVEEDCQNLINTAVQHYKKIDVLVNNAGVGVRGTLAQLSPQVISAIYNINAVAPVRITQMALPHIKQTKGSIIFISSLAGLRGLPQLSVYSAAKMSLTAIAQSIRVENYSDGIHVGLMYVGITENEKGKMVLDTEGRQVLLEREKRTFQSTPGQVALKIAANISSRKKQTVVGISGKIFFFLTRYFPGLFEFLLIRSQKKVNELYK